MLKRIVKISLLLLFAVVIFLSTAAQLNSYADKDKIGKIFRDSISVVNFSVVGDLMCSSVQYGYAETDSGYDFSANYKYITPFLNKVDFTIGNLETTLAGEKVGFSGYPLFNTPDEYLDAVKNAGFDFLVTSNNHSLDKWEKGLKRTINKIKEAGLGHTGTFRSQSERDSLVINEINGITFTILAYSYGTNGIPVPEGKGYLVNLIAYPPIKADIKKAKEADVDLIIVYYHFGEEYNRKPSYLQENLVKETIGFGADIILGSHPHVPQPIEFFKTEGANIDSGFVAYSLGNFISNQRWRHSDGGPILNFSIVKDRFRDSLYVNEISVVPTWVFKGKINEDNKYMILPSDSVLSENQYDFMTKKDREWYTRSYLDLIEVMSNRSSRIKFYSPSRELRNFFSKSTLVLN